MSLYDYNTLSALFAMISTLFCAHIAVSKHLRVSVHTVFIVCTIYILMSIQLLPLLRDLSPVKDNRILLPLFVIFYLIFYFSTELSLTRSLLIYMWSVTINMFASNIACIADAYMNPSHVVMSFDEEIILLQLFFNLAICISTHIVIKRWDPRVLLSEYTSESLWGVWLSVPILFLGLNIALLPESYAVLHYNSLYATYFFFSGSLFVLLVYLTGIFYSHMSEYIRVQEYKEAQRLRDIQQIQYSNLIEQIDRDRHARHDFKHTLHLISQLLATGDIDSLRTYIRSYTRETIDTSVKNYCKNGAINALLNYYEKQAHDLGIITTLQVDLRGELPLSDPEICSLLGNIMENAIDASAATIDEEKRFSLSIRIQNESMLYIVSSNTFDGELIEDSIGGNITFSSKKAKHHGIGLQSIRQTVDKYDGTLRITKSNNEFFLDIAIRI